MAEAKNANLFQANPVKKFPSNHVTQYLAKFQNKTANKFLDNPANPFLVNNVNLYLAKNADLFHLKNAKASQLRCAVEEAALVVMEDQVVDVDIRAEEDTVITVKKNISCSFTLPLTKFEKLYSATLLNSHTNSVVIGQNYFACLPKKVCK